MKIACPHCAEQLDVDPQYAGKNAPCPKCSNIFLIPVPSASIVNEMEPIHISRIDLTWNNMFTLVWRFGICSFFVSLPFIAIYFLLFHLK